jgi:hypothetical protein
LPSPLLFVGQEVKGLPSGRFHDFPLKPRSIVFAQLGALRVEQPERFGDLFEQLL